MHGGAPGADDASALPTQRPGPGFRRPDPYRCPKRPAADAELGFVRRPIVRWFDPHQLVGTAARVLASGFSTSYLDSRELKARVAANVVDRSGTDELGLDYVADLGDGWNSTYSVACSWRRTISMSPTATNITAFQAGRCSSWAATRCTR